MSRLRDPYFRERFSELVQGFPVDRVETRGAGFRQRKPLRTSRAVRESLAAQLHARRLEVAARAAARRLERALGGGR